MRFTLPRLLVGLLLSFLAAACADAPTTPDSRLNVEAPGAPVLSGDCYLGADGKTIVCSPQSPDWGDGCDEYHYDCGGDDCIASAPGEISVQGCTVGGGGGGGIGDGGGGIGGGGGGGGGGSKTPACPDYGCTEPEPEPEPEVLLANDMQRDTIPPASCTDPNNTHWEQLYCRSLLPDSTQHRKTEAALDQIAQRGGECVMLAQVGRTMLAEGRIRFFEWRPGDDTGYGHPNTDIQIGHLLIGRYDPTKPDQDFEHVLVHEIDHVLRLNHTSDDGWDTPHTAQCGG